MKTKILMFLICYAYRSHGNTLDHLTKRELSVNQSQILGGFTSSILKFPFMVHLIPKIALINIASTSSDGGRHYSSTRFILHPDYDNEEQQYDLGLIKMKYGMDVNEVTSKAVTLAEANHKVATGSRVNVAGWGALKENGDSSDTLRETNIPVVDQSLCKSSYRGIVDVTSRMFCAGNAQFEGRGPCTGDSGAPAIDSDGKQVGLVATSVGCGRAAFPTIFTDIGYFHNWIKDTMAVA